MNQQIKSVNEVTNSPVDFDSQELDASTKIKSRIVSKVLSPALQFWLKSQLEQVENLKVSIAGGDRQILTGKIPQVSVSANDVIYRGLHLTEVELSATGLRINIGQIIKGKPLQILESFPIFGGIKLLQSDLNACLKSSLLAGAIIEFLTPLLPAHCIADMQQPISLHDQQVEISTNQLNFFANILSTSNENIPLTLQTDFQLASGCELLLEKLDIQVLQQPKYSFSNNLKIDLGADVELQELTLNSGELICRGCLIINP
jgi:hypothetical protein